MLGYERVRISENRSLTCGHLTRLEGTLDRASTDCPTALAGALPRVCGWGCGSGCGLLRVCMLVNEVNATRRFTVLKLEKESTHSETGLVGRGGPRVMEYLGRLLSRSRTSHQLRFGTLLVCVPLSPPSEIQGSFTTFLTRKLFYFSVPPSLPLFLPRDCFTF